MTSIIVDPSWNKNGTPSTSSTYNHSHSQPGPSTCKIPENDEFDFADDTKSSTSGSPQHKAENPVPKQKQPPAPAPPYLRPRSNTSVSSGNRSSVLSNNSHKKRASCSFESKNSYDSASLSSCGSNQSRNSDYSFLGGKDEFVVEKESKTLILATTAKSIIPRENFEPTEDIKLNVQGYERTEGKTVVKTVKKLSIKKIDTPPSSLKRPSGGLLTP